MLMGMRYWNYGAKIKASESRHALDRRCVKVAS